MIIILIIIGIIIGAIICFVVSNRNYSEVVFAIGLILAIIAIFATLFVSVGIIDAQANKDVNYQNKLYEREMLEYRIDNIEDDVVGNEMLYNDIVEFNNELRAEKKWANNPWTNWFCNKDIAAIDYIELDKE